MTILEKYCELKNWQGGTIHQMHEDFKSLPIKAMDSICGKLMDSKKDISDYENISWFMNQRVVESGIVIS